MKTQSLGMSLRYKLLAVLTVLPLISLASYLLMATNLFEKDKVAYVFDSSVAASRSLANQIQVEFDSYLNAVKPVVERYDYDAQKFTELSQDLFLKQSRVEVLMLFQKTSDGKYVSLGDLHKGDDAAEKFRTNASLVEHIKMASLESQTVFERFQGSDQHIAIGYRIGEKDTNHIILVSLYRSKDLVDAFANATLYKSFLVTSKGTVSMAPSDIGETMSPSDLSALFEPIIKSKTPEGTAEVKDTKDQTLLLSYSKLNVGGLSVASIVGKSEALRAVDLMVSKSILFFIALLSGTVMLSVFASISLTSTLRELYEATQKIGQGDFNVRVTARSKDEVGGLAESFNWMAEEVSRLLSATAESARMETELATVKTVQDTFFPAAESSFGPFDIAGHFEPASECGGDWWSYCKIGNRLFLWIGDATGHGTPAALITSAARSAAAIIETLPDMTTAKGMQIMNQAIRETSKGKIMMTFFLACIDLDSNVMTYSSASHDPPYLLRRKDGQKLKKKDLLPLMEGVGPRLGDRSGTTYEEVTVELQPGDALCFYTDGVMDVHNSKGEGWGEREFVKSLMRAVDTGETAKAKMDMLKADISEYRQNSPLIDDVTLFLCEYRKAS